MKQLYYQLVGQLQILSCPVYQPTIMIAVNETKNLLNKDVPLRKPVEWTDELNKMKTQPRLDETSQELLSALNEFRNLHAKIIDEPVSEILTFLDMLTLVKERPNTEAKVTDLIKRTHKAVPESIQTWKKPLTRILRKEHTSGTL